MRGVREGENTADSFHSGLYRSTLVNGRRPVKAGSRRTKSSFGLEVRLVSPDPSGHSCTGATMCLEAKLKKPLRPETPSKATSSLILPSASLTSTEASPPAFYLYMRKEVVQTSSSCFTSPVFNILYVFKARSLVLS